MTREYGKVGTSIWLEDSMRQLPRADKALYFMLLLSPGLSRCGVVVTTPRRLAALTDGDTERAVTTSLTRLTRSRHILLDPATDEVFVRTYIHHDGLLAQPMVVAAMCRDYAAIASPRIRRAVLTELVRITKLPDLAEGVLHGIHLAAGLRVPDPGQPGVVKAFSRPNPLRDPLAAALTKTADPSIDPLIDPSVDPLIDPSVDPSLDPLPKGLPDPSIDPSADPSVDPSRFSRARASRSPTPTPTPTPTAPSPDPSPDPSPHRHQRLIGRKPA